MAEDLRGDVIKLLEMAYHNTLIHKIKEKSMSYKLHDGSLSTDSKIGDLFIVSGDASTFDKGSVIEFIMDDFSQNPKFKLVKGSCYHHSNKAFVSWCFLSKYKQTLLKRIINKVKSWFK